MRAFKTALFPLTQAATRTVPLSDQTVRLAEAWSAWFWVEANAAPVRPDTKLLETVKVRAVSCVTPSTVIDTAPPVLLPGSETVKLPAVTSAAATVLVTLPTVTDVIPLRLPAIT